MTVINDHKMKIPQKWQIPLMFDTSNTNVRACLQHFRRPILPSVFRCPAFDAINALSHPGVLGSRRLLASHFLRPGMKEDIRFWASIRLDCQRTKLDRHVRPPVRCIVIPSSRFSHVHVHLVGPLLESVLYRL